MGIEYLLVQVAVSAVFLRVQVAELVQLAVFLRVQVVVLVAFLQDQGVELVPFHLVQVALDRNRNNIQLRFCAKLIF